MGNIRCREEEKDYFKIWWETEDTGAWVGSVIVVRWYNGKLEISSQANLLSLEEMRYLVQWIQRTMPKPKYRITTVFDLEPLAVVTSSFNWINEKIEIEEVWE